MLALSQALRAHLESIHPAAPWVVLTLVVFLVVYATRKLTPKLWIWFDSVTPDHMVSHAIQALPAVGLGAVLSVLLTGGDFAEAWKGAVWGSFAPALHLILKALPVPYQGAVRAIVAKTGLVVLVFVLVGCGAILDFATKLNEKRHDLCDLLGEQQTQVIAEQAKAAGMTLEEGRIWFRRSCLIGLEQAEKSTVGAIGTMRR